MFYLLLLLLKKLGCCHCNLKIFPHHKTEKSMKVETVSALFMGINEAPAPRAGPGIQSALNEHLIHFE